MGTGASQALQLELGKPLDASDVRTPRGITASNEVSRLRTLLLAQENEHKRAGAVTNPETLEHAKHEDAANYEKAIIELFLSADDDKDGVLKLEEFRAVMQRADIGLSDPDILAFVAQIDTNGDNIIEWKEFLPVALLLVDNMEAQSAASKERMERQGWAEAEAMLIEAMYAPSFESAMDIAVAALIEQDTSGSGLVRRDLFFNVMNNVMAPEKMGGSNMADIEDDDPTGAAGRLMRPTELEKVANLLASGFDSDRRPLVDANRVKSTCLDVRFSTLKNDLLEMTNSALGEYLMEKLTRRAAAEEMANNGCGIEGAVMLTKAQIRKILSTDEKLCLEPFQVLSIMRSAKAHPIENPNSPDSPTGSAPKEFVDCRLFCPFAASTIEHMFDPKFLIRRSSILKRGALRPIQLLYGDEKKALDHHLRMMFEKFDRDRDGALDAKEFKRCLMKLELGLEAVDIEDQFDLADQDGDRLVNAAEFMHFAYASLLFLVREHALLLMDSASDAVEDGEVVDAPDLAGNPAALILQGRTKFAVARKLVADVKSTYAHSAADELIRIAGKKRQASASAEGASQMVAAVETFTLTATSFNEAKQKQIKKAEVTSPPVLETLFPDADVEECYKGVTRNPSS